MLPEAGWFYAGNYSAGAFFNAPADRGRELYSSDHAVFNYILTAEEELFQVFRILIWAFDEPDV